jgi:lysophospholipase L1-like esterase
VATAHWAGAYLQTAFTGTSVKVRTRNTVSFYASVDGGSYVSHSGVSGTVNLTSKPLAAGTHTLRIEYSSGDLAFEGLVLDSGAHTVAPSVPSGLLEFVGDSITAGAKDPRGALDAYGWKTGGLLHLRHTQIARAGYCLVGQSGCVGQATQFFDTDSAGSVPWNFSRYQATAVIINLGTNDLGHGVTSAQFQSAYISFLRNIRAKYPNAAIFVMETFKQWYVSQTKAAVAARNSAGDAKVYYVDTAGWLTSSDYVDGTHPTAHGHSIIANHLAPIIAAKI